MITETEKEISITIEAKDLYMAIADIRTLKEFMEKKDVSKRLIKSLSVADEVMEAFWVEHFAEDEVSE